MVAGTAAVMEFPEMDLDAVDPGRMLFGIGFAGTTRSLALRPAIRRWITRLLLVKEVRPADVAPYAAPFELTKPMRIGVIPLGWGDGMRRPLHPDACVLVRGKRVPLLPPSHFEHMRVDLTEVPDASYGDEVVILGQQGAASVSLSEVSAWAGKDELHFLGTLPRHIERVAVTD
jgi:alanine racemase